VPRRPSAASSCTTPVIAVCQFGLLAPVVCAALLCAACAPRQG
jgi:hypothetical protein